MNGSARPTSGCAWPTSRWGSAAFTAPSPAGSGRTPGPACPQALGEAAGGQQAPDPVRLLGQGAPGRRSGQGHTPPDRAHGAGAAQIVFLEDYDIEVAGHVVRGADVWLNTPRRFLE